MRVRHRRFIAALIAAVAVAFSVVSGPASADSHVQAVGCPSGTSWDNLLQRCV